MPHTIKEIKHVRDALKAIHFDSWLVLDLDNTVMKPRLALGGDAWFEGLFTHCLQHNIAPTISQIALLSVYNAVQDFVRTSAVELNIVLIIKALQDIGIPVIGLTARGYSISQQTIRQLGDMGVDFSQNSIIPDNNSSCQNGIIFCDGKDKGEKLKEVFTQLGCTPSHVAMIDDKNKHLERMKLTLDSLKIPFSGFRYSYLDEEVQQFNMEQANVQLTHLWDRLSPAVQKDILDLKLLPNAPHDIASSSDYEDSFFQLPHHVPVVTLPPVLDNQSPIQQPKSLVRSQRFFYKKNQDNVIPSEGVESPPPPSMPLS
ncbi:MAG: DUF2608 domain-containing protein [Legionella sp.]|uniref:DUF2608 domain-containing protein n=1 Tax=Legionella sp. TaxID=459 RepID=UPI0028421746|nr:DUF2608 domain-containing protein [Legionella sp.]